MVKQNKTSLKLVTKQTLKNSSFYPLSQVAKSRSLLRKIWWIFILIVGIFGSVYQVTSFLLHYLTYPVVVDLKVEKRDILNFPAVTVCNLNRMKRKFVSCMENNLPFEECNDFVGNTLGNSGVFESFLMSERRSSISCSKQFSGNKNQNLEDMTNFLAKYIKLKYEERKLSGNELKDLILYCFVDDKPCEESHFNYFQNTQYGNCFTFNKKKNNSATLKVPIGGKTTELEMILDLSHYIYLDVTSSQGTRIIIHDPNEDPNPEENGINISPGFETSVKVKQVNYRRLMAPYPDKCIEYQKKGNAPGENQRECIQICIQELNLANCTCIDPTMSVLNDKRLCNISNLIDACCLDNVINNIAVNGLPCKCPPACLSTNYEKILSVSKWPAPWYDCDFCHNKYVHNEMASLKVRFSTLEQIIYEQNPMFQDSQLYSNVGSLMNLWLGLSLLIFFEIAEMVTSIFTSYYKRKKK